MLKIFRLLNYIVNGLIIVFLALCLGIIFFGKPDNLFGPTQFLIGIVLVYSVLTSLYFVIKSSEVSIRSNQKYTGMLDVSFAGKANIRFRFDRLTGYSNIILAGALIVYSVYILISDPIKKLHGYELMRLLVLLFSLFYSIVQIYYSVVVIRLIQKGDG